MLKNLHWMCAVLSIMMAVACSQNRNPIAPDQSPALGQLLFAMDAADNIASGTITIGKGTLTHVLPVTITNHAGSVTFNSIQVGHWNILVQLNDAEGVEIYTGKGDAVVTKNQTTTVSVQVDHNTGNLQINVEVPGLLLWNKLGSDTEVQNSIDGPHGVITGSVSYASVKFNQGVTNNDGNSYVSFDNSGFNGNKGTVEFWFKSAFDVVNGQAQGTTGIQKFLVAHNEYSLSGGNGGLFFIFFDDAAHGNRLKVYLAGTGPDGIVIQPSISFSANEIHHLAVAYDRNSAISGSKQIIIYFDGVEVASSNSTWNDYNKGTCPVTVCNELYSVVNHTISYITIDNLKIWNYPKTDFSDRFLE